MRTVGGMEQMATGERVDTGGVGRAADPGLRWSPAWALEPAVEPTTLVLSAGADRRVAIDGVAPDDRAAVEAWAAARHLPTAPWPGTPRARLLDRFVELGVVVPHVAAGRTRVVAADEGLAADLAARVTALPGGGLVVVVRSGADWPPVAPATTHLGVDLALHHTVVLGPLVVPGVTACLACLDARAARRWSRPVVPPRPAVQRRLAVAAALLDVQLGLVAAGTSPLVNGTIAWNLESGTVDRQSLYKLAGCPGCVSARPARPPGDRAAGRVALPWVAA